MDSDRLLCRWGAQWRNADQVRDVLVADDDTSGADDLEVIHAPWLLNPIEVTRMQTEPETGVPAPEPKGIPAGERDGTEKKLPDSVPPNDDEQTPQETDTREFPIEKGVPRPRGSGRESLYRNIEFEKFEVGDSVFVPITTEKSLQHQSQNMRLHARTRCKKLGYEFITSKRIENGREGVRIWRNL